MRKKIEVVTKPVDELDIELTDKTYRCMFNMLCVANMQEQLAKVHMKINEISPARMTTMILYSAINASGDSITEEEAVALAIQLGPEAYTDLYSMYFNSILGTSSDEQAKEVKKQIAHQFSAAMKSITE